MTEVIGANGGHIRQRVQHDLRELAARAITQQQHEIEQSDMFVSI